MNDLREQEVLKTFIGKTGLNSARIVKTIIKDTLYDISVELIMNGELVYMSVAFDVDKESYEESLDTAKEFAAVLNTYVAEVEAERESITNG